MILGLVDEAVVAGARQREAAKIIGLPPRTLQRWRGCGIGDDRRAGRCAAPANKLSADEEQVILDVVNAPAYRDLSPKQIVPILADKGSYLASESTVYRVLRRAKMLQHRQPCRAPQRRALPTTHVATASRQVWSWDITYLRSLIAGSFYYLYMVEDIWSRKIVGWAVHETESNEHAARLLEATCAAEGVAREQLVLHADNGGPMKGATMLATLQRLGVVPSFSRPRVSDDNPFSEALFRTLKYRPEYPRERFTSLEHARTWVDGFVAWYNTKHRHSAIRFVTPDQRHRGDDARLLARRHEVYEAARRRHPRRWSGATRDWSPVAVVELNPERRHDSRAVAR
jgi:transposase InsO family protein